MRHLTPDNPLLYSALLTPQGKYLYDFFLWLDGDRILIELESERRSELCALLQRYKLRKNVAFDTFDAPVYQIFGGSGQRPETQDPRHAELGYRALHKPDLPEAAEENWTAHRLLYNVPDAPKDLRIGLSSPFEGNIDLLHGIAFDKGCYMGQELVSRIHHRGLVKRRFPDL